MSSTKAVHTFLAVVLLVPLASVVRAQITFIPGPQAALPEPPQLIATADFNRDGYADVAATDTTSGLVSILLGGFDGFLHSQIDISLGHPPSGIAAGDLNCDGSPDLAVVDAVDDQLFVLIGNGDGSFKQAVAFPTGSHPVDVVIGHFDGANCPTAATLNRGDATFSIFAGITGDGPLSRRDTNVGIQPVRFKAADLNLDGYDDVVVLGSDPTGSGVASVLIDMPGGSGTAHTFPLPSGSIDFAIADFTGDGVPDIAVLNGDTFVSPSSSTITLCRQQTEASGGKRVGTGVFDTLNGLQLACPSNIHEVPISCTPTSITASNYDGDGFFDLAVSFSTQALDDSTRLTAGIVSGFAGRGDGAFDFSAQALVGVTPVRIASADFTGDGMPDVAIVEGGTKTVRIVRSVAPPPPRQIGFVCGVGSQCVTTFCVDYVCCTVPECPTGQRCNIRGSEGICVPLV